MVQRRDSPSHREAFLFCQQTWVLSAFPTGHYSTSTRPNRWTVTESDCIIACCFSVIHRNSISLGIERLFTLPSKSVVHFCVCVSLLPLLHHHIVGFLDRSLGAFPSYQMYHVPQKQQRLME